MPIWAETVATVAVSLVSAYIFLLLRCRGTGYPFGPRARWWAFAIIGITAAVSTGLGLAAVAVGQHGLAAYVGLLLPSGLWLSRASAHRAQRRHGTSLLPQELVAWLALPLHHLEDRMGDDMQNWCDTRLKVAASRPQWLADAAQYYYNQVKTRLKDTQDRDQLNRWRESIAHKVRIVRLVNLDTTPERLRAALLSHPSTANTRTYSADDLGRLTSRLLVEAENELHLFLAYLYRLGYYKLLIYPFRKPPAPPAPRGLRQPTGPGPAAN
jgi:hypothetical protein